MKSISADVKTIWAVLFKLHETTSINETVGCYKKLKTLLNNPTVLEKVYRMMTNAKRKTLELNLSDSTYVVTHKISNAKLLFIANHGNEQFVKRGDFVIKDAHFRIKIKAESTSSKIPPAFCTLFEREMCELYYNGEVYTEPFYYYNIFLLDPERIVKFANRIGNYIGDGDFHPSLLTKQLYLINKTLLPSVEQEIKKIYPKWR